MLTEDEQKKRAQKISSLYLTPLKRNNDETLIAEKMRWRPILAAALFFCVPLIFANTLYDFYFLGTYTNVADIQAASILFIVMLLALFAAFVICFKASFDVLYNTYSNARAIYWLSFVATFTFVPFLRIFISGKDGQSISELVVHDSVFAGACIVLTSLLFVLVTKIVLRLANPKV